jgi:hypothetical protein
VEKGGFVLAGLVVKVVVMRTGDGVEGERALKVREVRRRIGSKRVFIIFNLYLRL